MNSDSQQNVDNAIQLSFRFLPEMSSLNRAIQCVFRCRAVAFLALLSFSLAGLFITAFWLPPTQSSTGSLVEIKLINKYKFIQRQNNMTRRELIAEINRCCYFSNKHEIEYILQSIERIITEALMQGKTIKLNGFLKFYTKLSSPRQGKFKGKNWKSEPKWTAYVKVSPVLNDKIDEYKNSDWLDRFSALSDEEQYYYVQEAQRLIDGDLD